MLFKAQRIFPTPVIASVITFPVLFNKQTSNPPSSPPPSNEFKGIEGWHVSEIELTNF